MSDDISPVRSLSERENWEFLSTRPVGRLATSVAQEPDIFPVNFVVDRGDIVIRTAQGSKLLELTVNPHVAFEADDWEVGIGARSVVVRGRAEIMESHADREYAESLPLRPWAATQKTVFVRIHVQEMIGRAFDFAAPIETPVESED